MKIICKHNGKILDEYGFGDINILKIQTLNEKNIKDITKIIQFRATNDYDFEYGIGGSSIDEYYKIKNIKFSNNNTEIIVKVSKI